MNGWRETTLGEVCDQVGGIIQTGPFGSQLHESDYSAEGIPVVMPKDIIEGRIATDSIARVSTEHVARLSRHKLRSGDIVYGRRGDIGRQALIRPEQDGWMCGTGCLRLSFGESVLNPLFLHYYLRQDDVVSWITNQAVGATMPNLNTGILRTVPVRFPPLPMQRRIAGILSAYDELIENSQRRIRILEAMARALYREWFVHFRFPSHEKLLRVASPLGEIPKGWEVKKLSDFVTTKYGYTESTNVEPVGPKYLRGMDINKNGFIDWSEVPYCPITTVYLDKPMRNHTLMQTIARANRVFPGKHSGVIVDYANVFASLEKALAIYGAGKDGKNPVKDKQKLVEELRKAVADATAYCARHQVALADIEKLTVGMERLKAIEDAVNSLISPDPIRRDFFGHERLVVTLHSAVKPDPSALEFAGRVACITTIGDAIRAKLNPNSPDISQVMGGISDLLDESIIGITMREHGPPALDLSKINFEALAKRFKQSNHKNTDLEVLKAAIRAQLEKLLRLNRTRADFAERFEELIASYNAGSRSIEYLFEELVKLSNNLTEDQERHVRENMTEEELVIFDILTRPAPELTPEERAEVKKVARTLLERLKQLLVLNWRQKSTARSQVKLEVG